MIKKKVLIPIDLDMKKLGQMEQFYIALGRHCAEKNIAIHFIVPKIPVKEIQDQFIKAGVRWFVFNKWWKVNYEGPRKNLSVGLFIFKLIHANKYNLVLFNFCSIETVLLVALLINVTRQKAKMAWVQHSEIYMKKNGFHSFLKNFFSKIRVMSLFVEKIYCVSKQVRTQVQGKYVAEDKTAVLYNGIDFKQFFPVGEYRNAVFSEFGYKESSSLVIVVANPRKEKGIQVLLAAVPLVISKYQDVNFLIVGDGPYLEQLKNMAQQYNISNCITFAGSRNDVPRLLSAADIAVQPSLKESFGNSVVEAMAAGLPVIGSAVGGIPEIIEDGTGVLVPAGDSEALGKALVTFLNNKQMAVACGENARKSVNRRFSLEIALDNYIREFAQDYKFVMEDN